MKKLALLIIALFSAVPVADAAETQSLSMSDNASVRLVTSGQRLADGTMWAGIDIAMPPDTNTYWRVPGETGVPLVMDWNQSRNITAPPRWSRCRQDRPSSSRARPLRLSGARSYSVSQ